MKTKKEATCNNVFYLLLSLFFRNIYPYLITTYCAATPVKVPVIIPLVSKIGKYQNTLLLPNTMHATKSCPILWNIAPMTLSNHIIFCGTIFFNKDITRKHKIPPPRLKQQEITFPVSILPRRIRRNKTNIPSFHPHSASTINVMVLASPSLIPGIGARGGKYDSTTNIVKAIVVNMDNCTIFFIFILSPSFVVRINSS